MTGDERDTTTLQVLSRLVVETERLIRLAGDIEKHATTPQGRIAMRQIEIEVKAMLGIFRNSIEPLYQIYDIDPGMKAAASKAPGAPNLDSYDEDSLWSDVKKA